MIPMARKSPVDSRIGQRLKEYRQHRGMTVRELAEAAHVTPGQISRYEHGRDRISHERVTEFARILRIKSNDLYQPPGSRLRRNHVGWRLTNFMAAVIAEAAALMSSRTRRLRRLRIMRLPWLMRLPWSPQSRSRSAPAPPQRRMRAPGTTPQRRPGMFRTTAGKIAHDSPVSATGKDTSAQSTPASANGDHSASPFKPTVDHHAIVDPGIKLDLIPTDHLLQHPADNLLHIPAADHGADPAHPYVDGNQSASADHSNAHPGKVPHDPPASTARSSDVSADDSAQPFKTNLDDHAVDDPETNSPSNSNNHPLQQPADNSLHTPSPSNSNNHPLQQPADNSLHTSSPSNSNNHPLQQPADNSLHTPAQHDDNGSPAVTDGAHPGLGVDGIQSASPKLADDGSTNSGKVPHDPPAAASGLPTSTATTSSSVTINVNPVVGSPNLKIASDGHGGTLITDPPAPTTTPDATVTPVAQTPTLIATEVTADQRSITLATVDEAPAVALNTAVAVAVALNTAVADPDGGKMSSFTLSGDD